VTYLPGTLGALVRAGNFCYPAFRFSPERDIKAPVLVKARSRGDCWKQSCDLPYGLKVREIRAAVEGVYEFLYAVNAALAKQQLGLLEQMALGNTFSGLVSEALVKNIAKHSKAVVRNRRIGGRPDLIPARHPGGDSQLRCDQGIEVKTSRQPGGWQGHNPESGWVMVFRYELASSESEPTRFVQILAAELEPIDWSLAERGRASRRTRTCSINQGGVEKLRANAVYQEADYVVGLKKGRH
jgi:hypothetical protein